LLLVTCSLGTIARFGGNDYVTNDANHPIPVTVSTTSLVVHGAPTDASGSIAAGGTSQQIFAGNTTRSWLIIQNISSAVLYINFGAAAVVDSNSIKLNANAFYESPAQFCPSGIVTIIGATTGQKFVAKQF
jgi:hypothetical protein